MERLHTTMRMRGLASAARLTSTCGQEWIFPPRIEVSTVRAPVLCFVTRSCKSTSRLPARGGHRSHVRTKSNSSLGTRPLCAKQRWQMSAYLWLYGFASSGVTPNRASASLSMTERD